MLFPLLQLLGSSVHHRCQEIGNVLGILNNRSFSSCAKWRPSPLLSMTSNPPDFRKLPSMMVLLTLRCWYRKSVSQQAWTSGLSSSSTSGYMSAAIASFKTKSMPLPRSSKRNKKIETSLPAIFFKFTSFIPGRDCRLCLAWVPCPFRRLCREYKVVSRRTTLIRSSLFCTGKKLVYQPSDSRRPIRAAVERNMVALSRKSRRSRI